MIVTGSELPDPQCRFMNIPEKCCQLTLHRRVAGHDRWPHGHRGCESPSASLGPPLCQTTLPSDYAGPNSSRGNRRTRIPRGNPSHLLVIKYRTTRLRARLLFFHSSGMAPSQMVFLGFLPPPLQCEHRSACESLPPLFPLEPLRLPASPQLENSPRKTPPAHAPTQLRREECDQLDDSCVPNELSRRYCCSASVDRLTRWCCGFSARRRRLTHLS